MWISTTSRSMWALLFQHHIPPLEPTQLQPSSNPAPLYSCSFTPLAVFFVSFQLIPPDENLVGHFKAPARGLTALDLTVSDSLLVLWSLSSSLKGLLQPIYSNPLFGVQLDQKGTLCNPKDRGGMMNTGTLSWCTASFLFFFFFNRIPVSFQRLSNTAAFPSTRRLQPAIRKTHFVITILKVCHALYWIATLSLPNLNKVTNSEPKPEQVEFCKKSV